MKWITALTDRPRKKLWRTLSVGFTLLIFTLGALATVNHHWVRVGLVTGAAVATALQISCQWLKDDAADKAGKAAQAEAVDIERRSNVVIEDSVTPLLRILARIQESEDLGEKRILRTSLVHAAVSAVPAAIRVERLRACYFVFERSHEDIPTALRYVYSAGRGDRSHTDFTAGTVVGDAAIRRIIEDRSIFCGDTDKDPPEGWTVHEHVYKTFLSVPVRGMERTVGMLTVDAPAAGDLRRDRDEPVLTVLARILAVGQIPT